MFPSRQRSEKRNVRPGGRLCGLRRVGRRGAPGLEIDEPMALVILGGLIGTALEDTPRRPLGSVNPEAEHLKTASVC